MTKKQIKCNLEVILNRFGNRVIVDCKELVKLGLVDEEDKAWSTNIQDNAVKSIFRLFENKR